MSVRTLAKTTASTKGQLGVEVTTSADVIHRGEEFLVDINISNAFDEDVNVDGWSWTAPAWINIGQSQEEKDDKWPIVIRSAESRTITFPMSSNRPFGVFSLSRNWPKTGSQLSHFNLMYSKQKNGSHSQSIPIKIDIRASPYEIYIAAIIGGIVGSLANTLTLGLSALVSGVLGLFLVLISQRRTDVQLGVSVEDAVGGLVVGFLVGYIGTSYFKGFLPKP
jgi:hypothetical protein